MRLLAVHSTSLLNPRAALSWEAQPVASGDEELHLPQGHSTHLTPCSYREPCPASLGTRRHTVIRRRLTLTSGTSTSIIDDLQDGDVAGCMTTADLLGGYVCRQLLRNSWIATFNAALRGLADREGIPLVDLETLHLQLPAAHSFQHDRLHPQGEVLVRVCMNLLLNMYEQSTGSKLLARAWVVLRILHNLAGLPMLALEVLLSAVTKQRFTIDTKAVRVTAPARGM